MSYTALYRKFRPSTFEDVKGQDHIVTTLKNQIRATASVMRICSAEPAEQEKRRSPRFSPARSTANIPWTEARATNVRRVRRFWRAFHERHRDRCGIEQRCRQHP